MGIRWHRGDDGIAVLDEETAPSPAVIGPYLIAFDTPGLVNPAGSGIVLDTFAVGTLILQALVIVNTPFTGGNAGDVYAVLAIGTVDDWDNDATAFTDRRDLMSTYAPLEAPHRVAGGGTQFSLGARCDAGFESFGLYVVADGEGLTQGAADIYVVTATPPA